MSTNKKIFIVLPDGVGLRNFAYSNFHTEGVNRKFDIVFWNNTPFDLKSLGFKSIDIKSSISNKRTELYKNACKQIELNLSIKRTVDKVYNSYRFPFSYNTIKNSVKSLLTQQLINLYNSEKGIVKLKNKINELERQTSYYQDCLKTLEKEKPAMIFCTNQRAMTAIAPILAANELKIPTACFIFSWDNLPKATMVIETDFYFVWSEHMKRELLFYYPYINENQIFITGTPQFEGHFDISKIKTKEVFFKEYGLDLNKKYICYSGDDITTCPDDPQYLEDVAVAIRKLNNEGNNLGIVFRRCPVDFSDRYDKVLSEFIDVITPIVPIWKKIGDGWNTILPTPEDLHLQINTIAHTAMVINLGSSMVFDYAAHHKPCAYINYDVENKVVKSWSVEKIYNYIHFRSMPNKEAVVWLNSSNELLEKIKMTLANSDEIVESAKKWFETIAGAEPALASENIWKSINQIVKK